MVVLVVFGVVRGIGRCWGWRVGHNTASASFSGSRRWSGVICRLRVAFGVLRGIGEVLEAACTPHAASVSFSGSFAGLGGCWRWRVGYRPPRVIFSCVHGTERGLEEALGVKRRLGWLVTWQGTRTGWGSSPLAFVVVVRCRQSGPLSPPCVPPRPSRKTAYIPHWRGEARWWQLLLCEAATMVGVMHTENSCFLKNKNSRAHVC